MTDPLSRAVETKAFALRSKFASLLGELGLPGSAEYGILFQGGANRGDGKHQNGSGLGCYRIAVVKEGFKAGLGDDRFGLAEK